MTQSLGFISTYLKSFGLQCSNCRFSSRTFPRNLKCVAQKVLGCLPELFFLKSSGNTRVFLCMRLMFWWSVCDVSAIEIVQYCTLPSYSISYLLNERLHHTQQTTIARFLLNNKQIPTNTDSLKCRRGDKTSTLFLMQPFSPAGMIQMIWDAIHICLYMSMLFVRFVLWFAILVCTVAYYVCMLRRFWWGISGM